METVADEMVRVAGRAFSPEEVDWVTQHVVQGRHLSRTQLMQQVCRRLDWRRPSGRLKIRECRDLLERLQHDGWLQLPPKRAVGRPPGSRTRVPHTAGGEPGPPLVGWVGQYGLVQLALVEGGADHRWWRELVGRYHDLGYRVPFGAHLRYLAFVSRPERAVVAALQVSSAAWRLAVRDRWIGWDDATRGRNLQQVVNHSRFVILPWVQVRNLASTVLARLARRLPDDWQGRYGVRPLLLETMVDGSRYTGSCYRAANWLALGSTAGRGRMDRQHRRHGAAPKQVLVYPLVRQAARRLREA
jgi:hypothetical protein